MSSDDGSLLQMVRREPVGEVRVTVNLDYGVDEKLPEGTRLSTIEQEFISRLPATLAERKFKLLDSKHVTVAGYPALAIRGDLEADGRAFRMKQYLILQDTRFWTLSTIGPRDAFDQKVEPEFDAIAATLKLQ
ncbi:MAG: hypothetical protein HUU35_14015 [Armatimonadetes bacterium]|nr:hypothetical protein [Armatimonadota bacterium]